MAIHHLWRRFLCVVAAGLASSVVFAADGLDPVVPRYAWRGHMLDVSRHFFTVDDVKKTLDLMHEHGLNVFHWHLTDGEGWRIQLDRYPELTAIGSIRKASTKRTTTMGLDVVDGMRWRYWKDKKSLQDLQMKNTGK